MTGSNPWPRCGAFHTEALLALAKGKAEKRQGPVLTTRSMLGSPSAGELTAAGSEMKSRGFQNRSELGKEHFPGELGSLAADQVVCEAIMCAAESTAQHSHFAAKPHHSPACLYQSSLSPAWLILWDRMCSESYYSPGKESPLINYLKDSAW